ncbi:ImuA family protein [Tropicimonas sp. IMCC34011]|uniref:ImuA family protein n=1 Tax=Tropicimonas sp. IMCC34011 TaxID=2248759 RepID=UPI000E222F7D|nr:hypothetical protein [Tropicimonas sp. IMCC34011]
MTESLHTLLSRTSRSARPAMTLLPGVDLALGRTHEICGPARRTLAVAIAGARPGPVIWIVPAWYPERLNGEGLTRWMDPARVYTVTPRREEDLLWCMEESLRSGSVPTVVAELPRPPGLTPVRRLHLAAETGSERKDDPAHWPMGLILTAEGGSAGIETRWSLASRHSEAPKKSFGRWRISRLRARSAPTADWMLTAREGPDRRLSLVPLLGGLA